MQSDTTISKWGNSLALRIPQALIKQAKISEGDTFALALQPDGSIVLRPSKPRYDLADLISGITPENLHRETDWGPAVGNESW